MVTLHHCPVPVSLATFDDFRQFRVNFKYKLFAITTLDRSNTDIFKRNDALWDIFCCMLEVVQTSIIENKPTPFPALPASSLQKKKLTILLLNSSRSSVLGHTCNLALTIIALPCDITIQSRSLENGFKIFKSNWSQLSFNLCMYKKIITSIKPV